MYYSLAQLTVNIFDIGLARNDFKYVCLLYLLLHLFHGCGAGEAWIGGLAFSGLWGQGGGACGLCPGSRAWCARALPFDVYHAGKLQ